MSNQPQFRTVAELAAFLDSLHEMTDDGGVMAHKWEPAQRALAALEDGRSGETNLCHEARELQRKHYGDGANLHLAMIDWAAKYDAAPQQPPPVGVTELAEAVSDLGHSGHCRCWKYGADENRCECGLTEAKRLAALSHQQPAPVGGGVVDELLVNIRRSCERGRNAASPVKEHSNFIATLDHIEDLAQQARRALSQQQPAPSVSGWKPAETGDRMLGRNPGPVTHYKPTPVSEPAASGESREDRMVTIERDESGKATVWCDPEIVDLVSALNAGGVRTIASCSGHGHRPGWIALKDGRHLTISPDEATHKRIEALFPVDINGDTWDAASGEGLPEPFGFYDADEGTFCRFAEGADPHLLDDYPEITYLYSRAQIIEARRLTTTGQGDVELLDAVRKLGDSMHKQAVERLVEALRIAREYALADAEPDDIALIDAALKPLGQQQEATR